MANCGTPMVHTRPSFWKTCDLELSFFGNRWNWIIKLSSHCDSLRKKPLFLICKGVQRPFGGASAITQQIKNRILGRTVCCYVWCVFTQTHHHQTQRELHNQNSRMVNWCKISESILETEFPSFGLLAHLGNAVAISKSRADLGANSITSLKVLAKTWNIDKELRG